jgi:methylthioribose-1-phosphate isomerase
VPLAPPGTETRTPTHDVTPAELITTWLLAIGPVTPPFEGPRQEPPASGEPA